MTTEPKVTFIPTCGVCGRVLKNPIYVAAGVGPVCARKRGIKLHGVAAGQLSFPQNVEPRRKGLA